VSVVKILVANRGDIGRTAVVAAAPERMARAARAGDFAAAEALRV
jgi:hypothetical protein